MNIELAIVIPSYRGRFLSETLEALASQTCKHFNVYIGNDNSPDDLETIIYPYTTKLNIKHERFEQNVGQVSLTKHWDRSIDLIGEENWVWLLPDDDIPSNDCVETFLNLSGREKKEKKLYRFQTVHVDENNQVVRHLIPCPKEETNVDFLLNKLKHIRNSSVAEYIFLRSEYLRVGRFLDIPLGWCSDDYMWICLSDNTPIETLEKGIVRLRQSNVNISCNDGKHNNVKLEAKYTFYQALLSNNGFMQKVSKNSLMNELKSVMIFHLFQEYKSYDKNFLNFSLFAFAQRNNVLFGGGFVKNIYRLLRFQFLNKR